MNWQVIQRIIGILLMIFSITMLPPIIISFLYEDNVWVSFLFGFFLTVLSGLIIWY